MITPDMLFVSKVVLLDGIMEAKEATTPSNVIFTESRSFLVSGDNPTCLVLMAYLIRVFPRILTKITQDTIKATLIFNFVQSISSGLSAE